MLSSILQSNLVWLKLGWQIYTNSKYHHFIWIENIKYGKGNGVLSQAISTNSSFIPCTRPYSGVN